MKGRGSVLGSFISRVTKKQALLTVIALLMAFSWSSMLPAGEVFDTMPDSASETVRLPGPLEDSKTSIEKAIRERRSVRSFRDSPLSVAEVSQLLRAAQGITGPGGRRSAPSAGALYPLEIYLVAGNVDGLPDGVYHYRPVRHELARVLPGDRRSELCSAALGQPSVRKAAAVIVFAAVYERTTVKYGARGIQYVYMEAGHAAQNVALQAVPLDLGTVVIGAFQDDVVQKVLKMSAGERPLYLMPVGRKH